jgi:photosystem II stability/assembly factor-like uncharacterized protein
MPGLVPGIHELALSYSAFARSGVFPQPDKAGRSRGVRTATRVVVLTVLMLAAVPAARAHDASAYGGLFRSLNLGGTWLNADVGLFLNAALTVAVDPRDPNHLLMGTDIGLLSSRNGGRSWSPEAQGMISGAVFAIAFSVDGETVVCGAPTGIFRLAHGFWIRAAAPEGAAPVREIVFGSAPNRIYLLGNGSLFISEDEGESYRRLREGPGGANQITAFAVVTQPGELLFVIIGGKIMASEDGGREWRQRTVGLVGDPVDTVLLDRAVPGRLWAASGDRIFVSDDLGLRWRAVGRPLPEPGTNVRGIAGDDAASTLVVTTDRGLYRSTDGGASWALKENNLPAHLEAGPLIRDPHEMQTLYAGYSLLPYPEVWRAAREGVNLLSRLDPVSLAGGFAFIALLMVGGALLVGWLQRRRPDMARGPGSVL